MRLDITAGAAVRFEPDGTRTIRLSCAGPRRVLGFNDAVTGALE